MKLVSKNVLLCSFNSTEHTLFQKVYEVEPLDCFKVLEHFGEYPKVFWAHRDEKNYELILGKIYETQMTPEIKVIKVIKGETFQPRFFGGRPFSLNKIDDELPHPYQSQFFFLPHYEFLQEKQNTFLKIYGLDTSFESIEPPKFLQLPHFKCAFEYDKICHCPTREVWTSQIDNLIEKIKKKELYKAVVARKTTLHLKKALNPYLFMKKLTEVFQNSSFFLFEFYPKLSFFGATPECLYSKDEERLQTEAIAGTRCITQKGSLLKSSKELDEFKYVTSFFKKALKPLSLRQTKSRNTTVNLGHIKHLKSSFEALLNKNISNKKLIELLFPSPALCGTPKKEALDIIEEFEPFSRGWYCAPVGWISEHNTRLIIAIRSMLLAGDKLHLFVGNGIVENSTAKKEWQELDIKIAPFLSFFNHENQQPTGFNSR